MQLITFALASALAGGAPAQITVDDKAWLNRMNGWVDRTLEQAVQSGDEVGVVYLAAAVDAQGAARITGVERSSGCPDLDAEALADLAGAAPPPNAPSDLFGQRFTIQVNMRPAPDDLIARHAFWRKTCH
jgi:TonB family protein